MKSSIRNYSLVLVFTVFVSSCGEVRHAKSHGSIILGDSTTIVTETDSAYLQDMVLDMEAKSIPEEPEPVAAQPAPKESTPDTASSVASPAPSSEGFTIDFGTVSMTITGVKTTEYQKQDPKKDAGVSYACTEGDITDSKVIISGASNVKLQQRYQTKLALKTHEGSVVLTSLGMNTSDWVTLSASNQTQRFVFDLNLKNLTFNKVTNRTIKTALEKELRRQRASSATINKWLKEIRHTRNAGDAPCNIILHNVQWRISGTDVNGKRFFKTIRMEAKAV